MSAPEKPDEADVEKKINLQNDNNTSEPTQYVIGLDTSLFSNNTGDISRYLIYIRQGK